MKKFTNILPILPLPWGALIFGLAFHCLGLFSPRLPSDKESLVQFLGWWLVYWRVIYFDLWNVWCLWPSFNFTSRNINSVLLSARSYFASWSHPRFWLLPRNMRFYSHRFFIFYLWMILGMIPGKISRRIPISEKDIVVGHPWIWLKAFVALGVLIAAEVFLVGKSQEIGKGPEVSSFVMSAIIMGTRRYFSAIIGGSIAMITKKNTDIITGSVIGSNIFYGCFVFGTTCFYNFDFKRNF